MAVGISTGRRPIPLFFVPEGAKVNSRIYVEHVLRPLVEVLLPELYPGKMNKVWVHHDGASSRTSNETKSYIEEVTREIGIRFIKKAEIPAKSPDAAPLDFFGFGFLKGKLQARRPRTIAGLKRAVREEWAQIDPAMVMRAFKSWIERAKMTVKKRGRHIENVNQIHNKRVLQ